MKIFIASSSDLAKEREKLEVLLYREKFEPIVWENIDQSITGKKFQERINEEHLNKSDIVIFMVKSRLGKFTLEEFEEAYTSVGKTISKMYIYFFKEDKNKIEEDELLKILTLKKFLKDNGDYPQEIENFTELENHFLKQKKYFTSEKKEKMLNENEMIVLKFLQFYSQSWFNIPRIINWGTQQNGFSKLRSIEYPEMENILIELEKNNLIQTKSSSKNTHKLLYKIK